MDKYKQIQAAIANAFVWVYLVVPDNQVAAKKSLKGYTWRPISQARWSELS
jgi:hypothetical protein